MKSLKYILLFIIISLNFSCEDFLVEDNKSNITAENYFSTSEGYQSLVNASYATLRNNFVDDPWLFCLGVDIYTRGKSVLIGGSYENRDVFSSELNEYGNLDAQNQYVSDFYYRCYQAIQTCNTAISRAKNVNGLNENKIKQLVAEVKFIRAYNYYLLVEQFGDVPLVKDEINGAITHFDRIPEEDIYKFIISELEESEVDVLATPEQFGKVTKGAVNSLLSLIYLTRGYKSYGSSSDFTMAASLADGVINSGKYALLNTFKEVFTPGNEKNNEIIFSIQYDAGSLGTSVRGNGQSVLFGWELWLYESGFDWLNTTYNNHEQQFMPTQFLYSLFDTSIDSRYDATFKSEFYATINDASKGINKGDLIVYFPKWDENFTAQDEIDLKAANPNVNIYKYDTWKQDFNNIGGAGKWPMVWKFFDPNADFHGNNNNRKGTRDIFMFRLSELYLIAAEAYHMSDDDSKAAERINTVRRRAAIPGNQSAIEITSADVDLDFILDERARELTGEYKRWFDLKRTGKLIERTLLHNNLAKMEDKMTTTHILRPIPQSVIDHDSGEFPQNLGYK
ncbi:RagB/SusD family nutrient uptake outer membrane protein [Flavobacterium sp. L1I52]|uniref:RagB/SusD family nutrient uptake outer membrane protein n=1 Tax=Flavobacterium pokkalii TaxID=1940408 RepID=A0ABR7UV01_9FLAO|nr:RagB/SusD family nutrient uptake outer membrane protein [Flavobacterium pokkalii]MBD0725843.1 RagB/SusD family nutrient uptake outer membrane protein [Flavobacterium pokkalii]